MKLVKAMKVDEPADYFEIDETFGTTEFNTTTVAEEKDVFATVKAAGQTKKVQNRIYYLQKKAGADSKQIEDGNISGYRLFEVVEPPYNLEALASLFDENAIHNAAISARVMNTVGLGYKWRNTSKAEKLIESSSTKPESAKRARAKLQRERENLDKIFKDLTKNESFTETLIKVWLDALATGNGYLEIGRNRNGSIGYIGHIPSIHMRVRKARDGFVQSQGGKGVFFRNFGDRETEDSINGDPNPNEVIHVKIYSPTNTYYGVPPAVSAISAIIGDKFAKEYNIDYFENKAVPRYAVIVKGAKLSPKAKQELVNYFKNEVKGTNHGTLIIPLPAAFGKDVDIKFEKLEAGVQEGSFDKYRKSNRDEIAIANRVPAPKIGIYDNANLAVSRDADKTFKVQVVGPDQRVLEFKLNKIVDEFSDLLELQFEEIDIVDDDIRSRIFDRYLRTEVMTPNEVRGKLGLHAIEGGDEMLPYPTRLKEEEMEFNMRQAEEANSAVNEAGANRSTTVGDGRGAPVGNQNAAKPDKTRPDSPADATTGRAERGSKQDEGAE